MLRQKTDMEKDTENLLPSQVTPCKLTTRCCQQLGILLICGVIILSVFYQKFFTSMSSPSLMFTIPFKKNISSSRFPQFPTCPKHPSILKSPPMSLPCGMSVNTIGRLGNLMGEYATLFALAEINKRPAVILPEMADILKLYFANISLPTITVEERTFWETHWKVISMNDWMEPKYKNLTDVFTYLYGYPNSWTFYHHIRDRILQEFRFHNYILDRTHQLLNQYRKGRNSVTFVGVHNRRGDYVSLMTNAYHGVVADGEFFQKAFSYFDSKYPDAVFLVASDDLDWCKKNMNNSKGNIYFVGNKNGGVPVYDLALMANCNHSIITIGTFGYWSAYLAGGETVYLSNYLMPDSTFLKVLKYEAFYLPEWIPIAANLSAVEKL